MNEVRIAFTDNELCLGGGGFSCKVCHFGSQCQSGSNSFDLVVSLGRSSCVWRLVSWRWSMWPAPSTTSLRQLREFYQVTDGVWQAFTEAAGDPGDDVTSQPSHQLHHRGSLNLGRSPLTYPGQPGGDDVSCCQTVVVCSSRRGSGQLGGPKSLGTSSDSWLPYYITDGDFYNVGAQDEVHECVGSGRRERVHHTGRSIPCVSHLGNFITLTGGLPSTEEEPTREQLAALHRKVFILNQPPYADFVVFTPSGKKFRSTALSCQLWRVATFQEKCLGHLLTVNGLGATEYGRRRQSCSR